ncbi:hypothetical protein ACLKA7_005511 [Drosophila subpalustris]
MEKVAVLVHPFSPKRRNTIVHFVPSAAIRTSSSNTPGVCVCQQQHQSQHSAEQRDQQQHTWCVCVPTTTSIAKQRRAARPAATLLVCVCDDATSSEHHASAGKSLLGSTATGQQWYNIAGHRVRALGEGHRIGPTGRTWYPGGGLETPGSGSWTESGQNHPGNEILVGSVSHSWVHHLTSPERDDSVPKSEPGGPGGRMRTTQRASGVSSSSSRGHSWTRIFLSANLTRRPDLGGRIRFSSPGASSNVAGTGRACAQI